MSKKADASLMPFDPSQGRKDRKVPLIQVARMVDKRIKSNKFKRNESPQDILKFAWVEARKLVLNYMRQRYPEPKHIGKLHVKWNIICVTPLQARYSKKEDLYYIADGQQHGIDYVLQYGEDALIPVFYVESEDENVESIQLLALNTDNEPMAKFFIHQQKCIMGDVEALAIEKCVIDAGCETSYKKRSAGTITHISDLYAAVEAYGVDNTHHVLSKMRHYWPAERIHTASMLGFLKVKQLMEQNGVYTDDGFEDVFNAAEMHFENSERLHLDIKDEFERAYPTNYKGMGVREKIASGLINVYEKTYQKPLCPMPFVIDIPMMAD